MTGKLIDYPPFDLNRSVLGTAGGNDQRDSAVDSDESRPDYVPPRFVELPRSVAVALCGEAGCAELTSGHQ